VSDKSTDNGGIHDLLNAFGAAVEERCRRELVDPSREAYDKKTRVEDDAYNAVCEYVEGLMSAELLDRLRRGEKWIERCLSFDDEGAVLRHIYSGILLVTNEGNRLGVCMRDDTFEINVLPKGGTGRWHRADMRDATIGPMTTELAEEIRREVGDGVRAAEGS